VCESQISYVQFFVLIFSGQFVMEYVGEVLDYKTFKSRTKQYAKSGESHFYFIFVFRSWGHSCD
jgi:hypothetical protein